MASSEADRHSSEMTEVSSGGEVSTEALNSPLKCDTKDEKHKTDDSANSSDNSAEPCKIKQQIGTLLVNRLADIKSILLDTDKNEESIFNGEANRKEKLSGGNATQKSTNGKVLLEGVTQELPDLHLESNVGDNSKCVDRKNVLTDIGYFNRILKTIFCKIIAKKKDILEISMKVDRKSKRFVFKERLAKLLRKVEWIRKWNRKVAVNLSALGKNLDLVPEMRVLISSKPQTQLVPKSRTTKPESDGTGCCCWLAKKDKKNHNHKETSVYRVLVIIRKSNSMS